MYLRVRGYLCYCSIHNIVYIVHASYTPFKVVMANCAVLCVVSVVSYCCNMSEVFFT